MNRRFRHGLSRRAWFKAACVPLLVRLTRSRPDPSKSSDPPIIIVGGGLAGLRILDLLRRRGQKVRLLEASPRLGGRILTLRKGLGGLHAEAGAERILDSHARVQALTRELGLQLEEIVPSEGHYRLEFGQQCVKGDSWEAYPADWLSGLHEREKASGPYYVAAPYLFDAVPPARDDSRSALEWLTDQGLSPAAKRLLFAFCPFPIAQMSSFDFHRFATHEISFQKSFRIAGGTDALITALCAKHRTHIQDQTRVASVAQDSSGVWIRTESGRRIRGSKLILALPKKALDSLRLETPLSPSVRDALGSLTPGFQNKVHWLLPRPVLAERRIPIHSISDQFPQLTWPLPDTKDELCVVNGIGIGQPSCRSLSEAIKSGRLQTFLSQKRPELAEATIKILAHDFYGDPLAGGSYAYTKAGKVSPHFPVRDRKIWLAGSDFSENAGWMEGALMSAEGIVEEIEKGAG